MFSFTIFLLPSTRSFFTLHITVHNQDLKIFQGASLQEAPSSTLTPPFPAPYDVSLVWLIYLACLPTLSCAAVFFFLPPRPSSLHRKTACFIYRAVIKSLTTSWTPNQLNSEVNHIYSRVNYCSCFITHCN